MQPQSAVSTSSASTSTASTPTTQLFPLTLAFALEAHRACRFIEAESLYR
ncbi:MULTISPECIES: hypothetical protein [Paraburkholderia]|jgi:hypothetical protein|nr:hypothetical protein [Paraburkholderia hospita]SEI26622.1 hypothetical protein SAMN05192544_107341 [Paraburkholderia hospita]